MKLTPRSTSRYTGRPMNVLLWKLLRRLRPRIGWVQFLLGLVVVLCTALAASDSKLNLPANAFFWAGLLGLVLGIWFGRPIGGRRRDSAQLAPAAGLNEQPSRRVDIWRIVF